MFRTNLRLFLIFVSLCANRVSVSIHNLSGGNNEKEEKESTKVDTTDESVIEFVGEDEEGNGIYKIK